VKSLVAHLSTYVIQLNISIFWLILQGPDDFAMSPAREHEMAVLCALPKALGALKIAVNFVVQDGISMADGVNVVIGNGRRTVSRDQQLRTP
jgi:hypothetical protein